MPVSTTNRPAAEALALADQLAPLARQLPAGATLSLSDEACAVQFYRTKRGDLLFRWRFSRPGAPMSEYSRFNLPDETDPNAAVANSA